MFVHELWLIYVLFALSGNINGVTVFSLGKSNFAAMIHTYRRLASFRIDSGEIMTL